MKAFLTAAAALLFTTVSWLPSTASAQNPSIPSPQAPSSNSGEVDSNPAFWQAKFDNGGHYLVKLNNISSASKHEYVSNAVARVVEVTVAASGAVVARFYYFEPLGKDSTPAVASIINKTQSLVQGTANKASPGVGNLRVDKDYPNSTHAHTVEYALQSEAALNSLYQSLLRAIEGGRGRTWTESGK